MGKARKFDVQACSARIQRELASRGVSLDRREDIPLAQLYVARARELLGSGVVLENMFSHPLWVHVAAAHDPHRQSPVPDCQVCGLLTALWIPYRTEHDRRARIRRELGSALGKARAGMAAVRRVLAAHPTLVRELELLNRFETRLAAVTSGGSDAVNKAVGAQVSRRGRRPLTLVREIESTLKRAGFGDAAVAELVFGTADAEAVRSLRDRRRQRRAKKS